MITLATPKSFTGSKPSLLFVDDEPSILTALRVVFRSVYDVTVTTDGREAVELLKNKKFDVIVSDQRMPTMTGVELLQHARDLSPLTVRILLTGYSDTDAILGAINEVEVHRFLQKPWDNAKLKQTVNEAIELAKSLSEEHQKNGGATESTVNTEPEKKLADVVPLPTQHEDYPAMEEVPPFSNSEKDEILIVDAKPALFAQIKQEMGSKLLLDHATNLQEVFKILEQKPIGTIICAFDVQSEGDRAFIQMLKAEYPYILLIAVCDSTDSTRLIELINQAKIFRFIKKPVSMPLLGGYIVNALAQAEAIKNNPALIRMQRAEQMSDTLANSAAAKNLKMNFISLNKTLSHRLTKFLGFFRRK